MSVLSSRRRILPGSCAYSDRLDRFLGTGNSRRRDDLRFLSGIIVTALPLQLSFPAKTERRRLREFQRREEALRVRVE